MRTSDIATAAYDMREAPPEADDLDEPQPVGLDDPLVEEPIDDLDDRQQVADRPVTLKTTLMADAIRRTARSIDDSYDNDEYGELGELKRRLQYLARKLDFCLLPDKQRCRLRICPSSGTSLAKKRTAALATQLFVAREDHTILHLTTTLASDHPSADYPVLTGCLSHLKRQRWFQRAVAGGVTRIDLELADGGQDAQRRWNLHAHTVLLVRRGFGVWPGATQKAWLKLLGPDRRGQAWLTMPPIAKLAFYVPQVEPDEWLDLAKRPNRFIEFLQFFTNQRHRTFCHFGVLATPRKLQSNKEAA